MESRNPAFRGNAFGRQTGWRREESLQPGAQPYMYGAPPAAPPAVRPMTLDDVVVRGFLTLATLVVTAALAWALIPVELAVPVLVVSVIASLGVWAFITFGRNAKAPLVIAFAALYGVMVGIISHAYNDVYHGVVFQAVIGTALAFGAMLAVHALRIIRVTPKFARFVIAAGFALIGLMLVNLVVQLFGGEDGIGIRDPSNPLAYVFSVVAILVGCFFLLLDFDSIEQGVRHGAPETFAWYCAFGLVLSLVWIYLELLRFLSYFTGRD
ncbi:membrane protein [Actinomadura sp. NBRC 104412]|uniref:Bax inhibitor-1/YccA family protein n=1 Tax=Actinomadura sp. NBRC 104412 TaxID=3032203 RepID=UPI0024A0C9F0|nr:Bax inhibitor-1/YccA family protein [Actinomadura sp. NBRC 104412]GLZ04933.1 membrane protein [Actinomadura sp. NBRC 104412]